MRFAIVTILTAALVSPLMMGCGDKEVSHTTDQSTNPLTGNTTTTDKTTYQKDNGSTYTNESQNTAPQNQNK